MLLIVYSAAANINTEPLMLQIALNFFVKKGKRSLIVVIYGL